MNVSLSGSLPAFGEKQVGRRVDSTSERVREPIRRDQKEAAKEKLEALVVEGLESGEPIVVTDDSREEMRQELSRRHRKRKAS